MSIITILIIIALIPLAYLYTHFGTVSPCGMLRENIKQHDTIAAHLPDGLVEAGMSMQYGDLSPGRCIAILAGSSNTPIEQPTPPTRQSQNQPPRQEHLLQQQEQILPNAASPFPPPATAFTDNPMTPQKLAECTVNAAKTFQVPAAVLIGIMQVEDGHIGKETAPSPDGDYAMGPMQISSQMLPQLAQKWNVDIDTAHKWVRDDGCININVAAWILRQKMNDAGSLRGGIAAFHPKAGVPNPAYADQVIKVMDEKGLINHDDSSANNLAAQAIKGCHFRPENTILCRSPANAIGAYNRFGMDYELTNKDYSATFLRSANCSPVGHSHQTMPVKEVSRQRLATPDGWAEYEEIYIYATQWLHPGPEKKPTTTWYGPFYVAQGYIVGECEKFDPAKDPHYAWAF
jgi:Transglycosylase SLT domain